MSDRQNRYSYSDDDLEDDLGVASHTHAAGHLRSNSSFSRGDEGVASFDPSTRSVAPSEPTPEERLRQRASEPLYPEMPAYDASRRPVQHTQLVQARRPQPAATQTRPERPVEQRPRPRQERPMPSDPDANRAAFDARYGEGEYRSGGQSSKRSGSVGSFLERRRASRASRPRRRHPILKFFLVCIAVMVVTYLVVCVPIDRSIAFEEPEASQVAAATTPAVPFTPYYVLLLGSDAREGDEISRTDTMILARIDVIANQITMISIPRDTMVEIEGHGTQKINAAYAFGGTAGAISAASKLLNVPIAHAAIVHFDGVSSLVDSLGGITVDVPVDVYDPDYTGLEMSAGTYEMDGETALLFSRVRHGFALGDYQRQIDQQLVIQAIVAKARTLPPWQLASVAQSMGSLFDTSLRCYNVLPLFVRMLFGAPTVYQTSLPSTTKMVDGVSYVVVDESSCTTLMNVINAGGDPANAGVALGLEE